MTLYEELIRDFAFERRDFNRKPMTNKELAVIANAYPNDVIAEPMGEYCEMVVNAIKEGGYPEVGATVLGILKGKARGFIKPYVAAARADLDSEERTDAAYERGCAS